MFKTLTTLILSLLFSSCTITRYYKMDSFNHQVQSNLAKADDTQKAMAEQLNSMAFVEKELSLSPKYKPLLEIIAGQKTLITKTKADAAEFRKTFESNPLSKKSKIASNEKEYSSVDQFQKNLLAKQNLLNADVEKYNANNAAFNSELSKQKILLVDTSTIHSQLTTALNSFSTQLSDVQSKLVKAKDEVQKSKEKEERKKRFNDKLAQMKDKLDDISKTLTSFKDYYTSVKGEIKQEKKQVLTPEMHSYHYLEKIKEYGESINASAKDFNQYAAEIQKI